MLKSIMSGVTLGGVIGLTLAGAAAFAADWPQWRGINRDGKSPETGLLKEWPAEGLTPLWVVQGLGTGFSAVAVADGTVYVTGMVGDNDEGMLFAFDLAGKLKWKTAYGPEWGKMHPGARCTPTVDRNLVYVLSGNGRLVCCDTKTGAILWSKDYAQDFGGEAPRCGFAGPVLVVRDKVIGVPGGKDAGFVALDKKTGRTVWTSKGFSEQSAYCSPILVTRGGTRLVVTITMRSVAGLDPETGAVLWTQPFDVDAEDPNHSVTPVYEDGRIYVTSGHGKGGRMFELSPDGRQISLKWTDETLNCLHGGVVLIGGYVYGANAKGRWICLELATGKIMYDAKGVGIGSITYADGMLYCYGGEGNAWSGQGRSRRLPHRQQLQSDTGHRPTLGPPRHFRRAALHPSR